MFLTFIDPSHLSCDSDHIYPPGPPSYNTAPPTFAILCLQTLHPYQLINIYGSFKQIPSPELSHSIPLTIIYLISQRYLTCRISTSLSARAAGNIEVTILFPMLLTIKFRFPCSGLYCSALQSHRLSTVLIS